jgi:N utilization substance protein B
MLYQIDQTGISPVDLFGQFWNSHQVEGDVRGFAETLVIGVVGRLEEMDGMITRAASNWRIARMAVVDRNVLRMALYEMLTDTATPRAVVIDEAIEVGKKYGSVDSGGFINGILDSIRQGLESGQAGGGDESAD